MSENKSGLQPGILIWKSMNHEDFQRLFKQYIAEIEKQDSAWGQTLTINLNPPVADKKKEDKDA